MDLSRSTSGNMEDNVGIPEDLRCKRSDGKQWRCNALSMPDKTVCEKHYIQAKKRAANSAMRASMKKAKRKSVDDSDIYLESKHDEAELSIMNTKGDEFSAPSKKHKEKVPKSHTLYSPETLAVRSSSTRNPQKSNDEIQRDITQIDENQTMFVRTTPPAADVARNKSQKNYNGSGLGDHSAKSSDTSEEAGGQICHQCRRNDRGRVIWCLTCDRKGYCVSCIAKWYPDLPVEDIQRVCPVCCGTCNCKACLRRDNLIKVRIREMTSIDKLQHLHSLLALVLPAMKQIHSEQCFELEVEARLNGTKADVPRAKLHADEQMCCDCCKVPIIDYHRHCANCLYDLCLTCCRDLRQVSLVGVKEEPAESQVVERSQAESTMPKQPESSETRFKDMGIINFVHQFPDWKANSDSSIPCPPKEYGGCGHLSLALRRIFKTNWVAKLVKDTEEMVNNCKISDVDTLQTCLSCLGRTGSQSSGNIDPILCQSAQREDSNDNFLYCPDSQNVKLEGIGHFQKHWVRGEPIVVKHVFDCISTSSWGPMDIWRGIQETSDENMNDDNKIVKAIDYLDWSEVDIELSQFIKGYSEGCLHENGWPQMLKLKSWPSASALEEFLLYQRPEFISKLPLLEYIHSKWGLLNLAAKLPHDSMQTDVGPKIIISYGTLEELGRGDSVTKLHINMGDEVYLLMHTSEVKFQGWQHAKIEKIQENFRDSDTEELLRDAPTVESETSSDEEEKSPGVDPNDPSEQNECGTVLDANCEKIMEDQVCDGVETTSIAREDVGSTFPSRSGKVVSELAHAGALWDVFRRQDVSKLNEYLRVHREEFRNPGSFPVDSVIYPVYDQSVFLNKDHKRKLKEEFEIEPWTFEQHVGEAVFIPAGCPFQFRNLQSSVQLSLDFLSPESLAESARLAREIRCLPNDHEAKLQILEVGKISLYSASSTIREVEKLVLDTKASADLGLEDRNLTALVSENLEKMIKRRRITCI